MDISLRFWPTCRLVGKGDNYMVSIQSSNNCLYSLSAFHTLQMINNFCIMF